jgi:hypothetical protein
MRPADVSVSTVTRPGCTGTHANESGFSTSTIRWGYFRIFGNAKKRDEIIPEQISPDTQFELLPK